MKNKKPTLSQQIEKQASLINELYDELHKKNLEIKALGDKSKSIEELNSSVAEVEVLLENYRSLGNDKTGQSTIARNISGRMQELEISSKRLIFRVNTFQRKIL